MSENSFRLDLDLFEYVIAYNSTFNEVFLATIVDYLELHYLENINVRQYLGIIFDFYSKHQKIPNNTEIRLYLNTDELKNAVKSVLTKFKQLDNSYNIDELIKNTETFIQERGVFHAVKDTINEITNDNKVDTHIVYKRFEDACNVTLIDDLGLDYLDEIDRHCKDLVTIEKRISSGFPWLDKMLGGGFLESGRAVYNFVGATNSGKSIFLGNLAANILEQNRCVVIISLEMSEMVYAKRISAKMSGISGHELKDRISDLKSFASNYRSYNPGAKLIIKEFPPNSITVNHIRSYLKRLERKKNLKIDCIVLDYLTLLKPSESKNSMFSDGKTTAEDIRALSYPQNFGCPIITAGQTNRQGYDENPTIATTGESMGIPQTMDFQAVVWATDSDKELSIIHLGIQKSRFGPNRGTRAFSIDYDTLSLSEADLAFGSDPDELDSISDSLDILGK